MIEFRRCSVLLTGALILAGQACSDDGLTQPAEVFGTELSRTASREAGHPARVPMGIEALVTLVPSMDPPPPGCLAFFNSVITGHAMHLGMFDGVGSTCIVDQLAPDPDPPFVPPGPPPYLTATFTNPRWTLTAANGDELWIEGLESVAVISMANGALMARGSQKIVGGTGRFALASGELRARGINEDGLGGDDFRSRGWIRFDASDGAAR